MPEKLSIGERISIIRSQFCNNDNKRFAQLAGIQTTQIYARIVDKKKEQAVDLLDKL